MASAQQYAGTALRPVHNNATTTTRLMATAAPLFANPNPATKPASAMATTSPGSMATAQPSAAMAPKLPHNNVTIVTLKVMMVVVRCVRLRYCVMRAVLVMDG